MFLRYHRQNYFAHFMGLLSIASKVGGYSWINILKLRKDHVLQQHTHPEIKNLYHWFPALARVFADSVPEVKPFDKFWPIRVLSKSSYIIFSNKISNESFICICELSEILITTSEKRSLRNSFGCSISQYLNRDSILWYWEWRKLFYILYEIPEANFTFATVFEF